MILADRIRHHLADHGSDTNRGISDAFGIPFNQVANATRNLEDKGDVMYELIPLAGSRTTRLFSLCGGMTRDATPQMIEALNDLQRAWQ